MIAPVRLALPALAALALAGCHARSDDQSTLTANQEAELDQAAATLDAEDARRRPENAAAQNVDDVDTGNDADQTS